MVRFFKECPHPDDKQRKELSRELGLEPLQVKFWFQNKRTQMKASKLYCTHTVPDSVTYVADNANQRDYCRTSTSGRRTRS